VNALRATANPAMRARELCAGVADPELPVVTIGDLGILRDVAVVEDGTVVVSLTPTYSGCPATEVIAADVTTALRGAGFEAVEVRTVRSPAWTTDWITDAGRRKLAAHGIAPPSAVGAPGVIVPLAVRCPLCGSLGTAVVSRFGSSACRALYRCAACRETFDAIKPH